MQRAPPQPAVGKSSSAATTMTTVLFFPEGLMSPNIVVVEVATMTTVLLFLDGLLYPDIIVVVVVIVINRRACFTVIAIHRNDDTDVHQETKESWQ